MRAQADAPHAGASNPAGDAVQFPVHAPVTARLADFPELSSAPAGPGLSSLQTLMDVPVQVTAELGRARRSIGQILELQAGSVVDLDRLAADPVDLYVQGTLFARGEVVVVDDRFAIRIKQIVDPKYAAK
jgi:flagellar motor switch protein FliN/FliY